MKGIPRLLAVVVATGLVIAACAPAAPPAAVATQAPAAAVATSPAATGKPAEQVKLVIWWWGEQEAPGAQKWLDETVAKYTQAHPNITFETVLQSTDNLELAFQAAAAAKQGPDIQYFWAGMGFLQNAVWSGAVKPVDDLIPAGERAHYINNYERTFDGKLWGVNWYLSGNPLVYNPELFKKAGLDPSNPPKTWDELKAACGKLNAVGVIPISGGLKDGWFGGWLFSMIARQNYDSEKELVAASAGAAKFTDPKYAEYWSRLNELKEAGCWNKDINSVDYQQGQDLFTQGKSAMLFGNDTFLKGFADTMGSWDKIGLMLVPKYGSGKLADTYTVTGQGWGITSWTKYPQEAADFLVYMHTPERLAAWFTDTGVAPADDRMDPSLISQPQLKQVYKWETTVPGPNLENWIPGIVDHDAMMTGAQLLFSGDNTPAQLAQMTEDVVVKWRGQNPDAVNNFVILAK